MNVMTQAHALTKATVEKAAKAGVKISYAQMFKAALKDCHKKIKEALNNPVVTRLSHKLEILENITDAAGFVVVVGGLCIDWVSCRVNAVQNAPTCDNIEDARFWAKRVQNGNGARGEVVAKSEQIRREKVATKEMIQTVLFA